ncbi:MAG: cytochrome-c peroxidase [Deltaproteobacteria bacterium]|nr:cytochrome-c peroxidase [Deltaproteobacteria bacterium]
MADQSGSFTLLERLLPRLKLAVVLGLSWAVAASASAQEVDLSIPEGVLPPEIPADNPPTTAKIALGKRLFFDVRLSSDGTVSCATCHDPRHGFADGRGQKTSAGVGGQLGARNSPTVLNAAFFSEQFWDGRAATLEEQALGPFINPIEMGIPDHPALVELVAGLPAYPVLFAAAFGSDEVTAERIAQAIASFERTIISLKAPIDRFTAGDQDAISESARRGWELYNGKARCNNCHGHIDAFPLFTDDDYHNIGVATQAAGFEKLGRSVEKSPDSFEELAGEPGIDELGRFAVTKEPKDIGAFKTPHLRNIVLTPPYMHDGSEATLLDVVEYYDRGGNPNPWLDGGIRALDLTDQEKADLVELMKSFTSEDLGRFEELGKLMP